MGYRAVKRCRLQWLLTQIQIFDHVVCGDSIKHYKFHIYLLLTTVEETPDILWVAASIHS